MKASPKFTSTLHELWREWRGTILFLSLTFTIRSVFADWSPVPTGSMKPTIQEGDVITVNKMAYDLRVPFTHISLMKMGDPERGEIVVFDSKASDKRLVKRVIGLPGDKIQMVNNKLMINDKAIDYVTDGDHIKEQLGKLTHQVLWTGTHIRGYSSFPAVTVPEGHYLMLGDNRDNSADSRVIGFVPRAELVGRSKGVLVSFNAENYYLPRPERTLKSLN